MVAGKGKKVKKRFVSLDKQSTTANTGSTPKMRQRELDHEQHYDLDGVSKANGKIVIPSYYEVKK